MFLAIPFLILMVLFPLRSSVYASTIFEDTFDGTGELHNYNNLYIHAPNTNQGTFSLDINHLFTSGLDPFYMYTGSSGNNLCGSIDFNWSGDSRWTALLAKSTTTDWNTEVMADGNAN